MKIAHISDLHIQEKVRFGPSLAVLREFVSEVEKRKIELVCVTGDLSGKDAPHRMTPKERHALAAWFRSLSGLCPVLIIRGNHDTLGELRVFEKCASKYTINYIEQIDSCGYILTDETVFVVAVPYAPIREYGADLLKLPSEESHKIALDRLREKIANALGQNDQDKILLGHMPVFGVSTGTFEITSFRDLCPPVDFFEPFGFRYVGLGHIHRRQHVYGAVHYAGSPYPTDFGDMQLDGKGFNVVDTTTGTVEFVPLESWSCRTFHFDVDCDALVPREDSNLIACGKKELDNTYCKLFIHIGKTEDKNSLDMSIYQNHILRNGGHFDSVKFVPKVEKDDGTIQEPSEDLDTKDVLKEYIMSTQKNVAVKNRAVEIIEGLCSNTTG